MTHALTLQNVVAGYGEAVVLDDISFSVRAGSALAILGRNGAGKTTLCETLMGLTRHMSGEILWRGQQVESVASFRRARFGFGYVPQQREIFSSLNVLENLQICHRPGGWTQDAIFDLFPSLSERRRNAGNHLSGGEQQMLAIGRALAGNPKLLILDEPLEGLAPIIGEQLLATLVKIRDEMRLTILLIEQKADLALSFAQRAIVLDRGRIVYEGACADLQADPETQRRLLSVAGETPAVAAA
ncbi:MAG: ABC transporter ATP-binding protein [Pseudorhodoplanes sp.]